MTNESHAAMPVGLSGANESAAERPTKKGAFVRERKKAPGKVRS